MGLQTARHAPERPPPRLGEARCPASFSAVLGSLSSLPASRRAAFLGKAASFKWAGTAHQSPSERLSLCSPPPSRETASSPLRLMCQLCWLPAPQEVSAGSLSHAPQGGSPSLLHARWKQPHGVGSLQAQKQWNPTTQPQGVRNTRLSWKWRKGAPGRPVGAGPRAVVPFRKESSLVPTGEGASPWALFCSPLCPSGTCLGAWGRVNID